MIGLLEPFVISFIENEIKDCGPEAEQFVMTQFQILLEKLMGYASNKIDNLGSNSSAKIDSSQAQSNS